MEKGLYIDTRETNRTFQAECMLSNGDWAGIFNSEHPYFQRNSAGIVSKEYQKYWKPAPEKKYIAIYKTKADITKMDWCYGPVDYENFQKWKKAVEKDYTIIHEFGYEVKE